MRIGGIFALCLTGAVQFIVASPLSSPKSGDSADRSGTWTKSSTGEGWGWYDIALSSSGKNQIAVVEDEIASLYISSDYGKSWTLSSAPQYVASTNVGYWAVASSGDGKYLGGAVNGGPIVFSADYGATWRNATGPPTAAQWYDIAISSDGQFMGAVILGSYMWFSADYGATWDRGLFSNESPFIYNCIQENFFSIDVSDSGKYWVVTTGAGGYSNGNIYFGEFDKDTAPPGCIFFDPAIVAGVTPGSSQQWVGAAISGDGKNVTVVNSLTQGGVYTSSDYGATFSILPNAPSVTGFHATAVSSDATTQLVAAYASTTTNSPAVIYLSKDGGESWAVSSPEGNWDGIASNEKGNVLGAANPGVGVYSYLSRANSN